MSRTPHGQKSPALPTPSEMVSYLDKYILGQQKAKRDLTVSVYNHYMSQYIRDVRDEDLGRYHTLLLGPTGCGKTAIVKTLANFLGVPVSFISATSLVETGFRGRSVDDVVKSLLDRAHGNARLAERGILFIDEIDKVRRQLGDGRDVSGEGVQNAFLTMLDGRIADNVDGAKHEPVDTSRILFVCTGAFVGLDSIVNRRLGVDETNDPFQSQRIGFSTRPAENLLAIPNRPVYTALCNATTKDLIQFGMTPEFIGRFTTITALHELRRDDLFSIMSGSLQNSPLARRQRMAEVHGIKLHVTEDAIQLVADEAQRLNTGVRGLHRLIDKAIDSVDYRWSELADEGVTKVTINADCMSGKTEPKFSYRKSSAQRLDRQIREECLRTLPKPPSSFGKSKHQRGSGEQLTDSSAWENNRILERIDAIRERSLDWPGASLNAKAWWCGVQNTNPSKLLNIVEQIEAANATIQEYYEAFLESKVKDLEANVHFMKYQRAKKQEEDDDYHFF